MSSSAESTWAECPGRSCSSGHHIQNGPNLVPKLVPSQIDDYNNLILLCPSHHKHSGSRGAQTLAECRSWRRVPAHANCQRSRAANLTTRVH
jgi:hypothetical protein